MTALPGIALARMGYTGPPPILVLPAKDGTHYAHECHARAQRDERRHHVLCRQHGLLTPDEHRDEHHAPVLASRADVRELMALVRRQVGWFTSPLYAESWLWPAEEDVLVQSRRVIIVRSPLTGLNVLERLTWLSEDEEF